MTIVFSCANWIFSYIPILFIDISSLCNFNKFKWGTQLYICMIETAVLCIVMIVLTILEFLKLNKLISPE